MKHHQRGRATADDTTQIRMHFSMFKVAGQAGSVQNYDNGRAAGMNWTSADGLYSLFLESDTSYVLDGYPSTHPQGAQ